MLTITPAQLRALEDAFFTPWARAHLARHFPDRVEAMAPDAFAELVRKGVDTARGYGFADLADLARYLDLMFAVGPDFDRGRWARPILAAEGEPTRRMDQLVETALAQLEAAAA